MIVQEAGKASVQRKRKLSMNSAEEEEEVNKGERLTTQREKVERKQKHKNHNNTKKGSKLLCFYASAG